MVSLDHDMPCGWVYPGCLINGNHTSLKEGILKNSDLHTKMQHYENP